MGCNRTGDQLLFPMFILFFISLYKRHYYKMYHIKNFILWLLKQYGFQFFTRQSTFVSESIWTRSDGIKFYKVF